ncbi:MAG: hypothetical protein JSR46_08130, partial [Verrucomicrobia bacterium]|nr:hypothetical protein [Verrucomicrobiota bacterium]
AQTEELRSVTDATLEYADPCAVVRLTRLAPHIKCLCIRLSQDFTAPDALLEEMALPDLETLKLQSTSISHTLLLEFLKRAPKLRTLEIGQCEVVGDVDTRLELPHLERLDICSIGTALLGAILAAAPNLREMSLVECINTTGTFTDECAHRLQLHALETLQIKKSKVSAKFLEQILLVVPDIKKITLDSCQLVDDFDFERLRACGCLHKLEKFQVEGSSISPKQLLAILGKAEKLQELKLIWCSEIGSPFDYDSYSTLSLPELESIKVTASAIALPLLQLLLSAAPNVQTLEMFNCQNLKGSFRSEVAKGFSFFNLRYLYVNSCPNVELSLPWQILKAAPNIEHISLDKFNTLVDTFLDEMTLARLKILFCPPCTASSLQKLLSKSPELIQLNIQKLSGSFAAQEQLPLLKFKNLDACYATIDSAILVQFLQNAPNLEELDLRNCPNLSRSIAFEELDQINLQHLKKVKYTQLPQELIDRMRACSPGVEIVITGRSKSVQCQQKVSSSTYQVGGHSDRIHYVTRIFESKDGAQPQVRDYRLRVYDSLRFGRRPPIEWYNTERITLTSCQDPVFTKTKEELDAAWDGVRAPGHTFYLATYDMPCSDFLPSY